MVEEVADLEEEVAEVTGEEVVEEDTAAVGMIIKVVGVTEGKVEIQATIIGARIGTAEAKAVVVMMVVAAVVVAVIAAAAVIVVVVVVAVVIAVAVTMDGKLSHAPALF